MSFNPYAPSLVEEDVAVAPQSQGWRLEGGRLWVGKDACLPMVDPYSGASEDQMTMIRLPVHRRVLWPRFAFVGGVAGSISAAAASLPENVQASFGVVGLVGFLAGLVTPLFNRRMELRIFVTRRTRMKQRLWGWANVIGILFWFSGMFFTFVGPLLPFLVLLALLIGRWVRRRIFYYRRAGEQFEIGGLHPDAMALLVQLPPR